MGEQPEFTIVFEPRDEDGWIVARVPDVPGAYSQGRTHEEARENVIEAVRLMLTPDDQLRDATSFAH
jgi:predicted RNase H-like HicB family nuclease